MEPQGQRFEIIRRNHFELGCMGCGDEIRINDNNDNNNINVIILRCGHAYHEGCFNIPHQINTDCLDCNQKTLNGSLLITRDEQIICTFQENITNNTIAIQQIMATTTNVIENQATENNINISQLQENNQQLIATNRYLRQRINELKYKSQ